MVDEKSSFNFIFLHLPFFKEIPDQLRVPPMLQICCIWRYIQDGLSKLLINNPKWSLFLAISFHHKACANIVDSRAFVFRGSTDTYFYIAGNRKDCIGIHYPCKWFLFSTFQDLFLKMKTKRNSSNLNCDPPLPKPLKVNDKMVETKRNSWKEVWITYMPINKKTFCSKFQYIFIDHSVSNYYAK